MELLRPILGMTFTFALLFGCLWLLRKRKGSFGNLRGTARELELVDRLSLSPVCTLHIVRWGGETLLVAANSNSCTLLGRGKGAGA